MSLPLLPDFLLAICVYQEITFLITGKCPKHFIKSKIKRMHLHCKPPKASPTDFFHQVMRNHLAIHIRIDGIIMLSNLNTTGSL